MKERPIIFSGPLIPAILEGRKTQTRRAVKHPFRTSLYIGRSDDYGHGGFHFANAPLSQYTHPDFESVVLNCPYGKIGDRLWVREAWGQMQPCRDDPVFWRADYSAKERREQMLPKWRPSIHMPRWASRITLEITDVRVERVQDISEDDALAEGVPFSFGLMPRGCRGAFQALWDSINAKRGFGWGTNPWVWALTFRRVEPSA